MKLLAFVFATIAASAYGQCPSGFIHHGESCYALPMVEGSWADGMTVCHELGAELAKIESAAEQTFLQGFLQRYGAGFPNDADFWVGGADFIQDGRWVWVKTDQVISPTFWATGQPNNNGGSQGCLRLSETLQYQWEDGSCDSTEYPVCELPFDSNNE